MSKAFILCCFSFMLRGQVLCEWIEITHVLTRNSGPDKPYVTTPKTYEVIMKSPLTSMIYEDNTTFISTSRSFLETEVDGIIEIVNKSNNTYKTDSISNTNILSKNITINHLDDVKSYTMLDRTISENNPVRHILNLMQNNLLQYSKKTVKSKISILKHLRDQLLLEVEKRISNLWADADGRPNSEAREYKGEYEDHHMDFPSNEGALMTIGFLTFAVFLVKLVLKLIHVIKYKQQYNYGTTTTTAASVFLRKRDVLDADGEVKQILRSIEEYPYQ